MVVIGSFDNCEHNFKFRAKQPSRAKEGEIIIRRHDRLQGCLSLLESSDGTSGHRVLPGCYSSSKEHSRLGNSSPRSLPALHLGELLWWLIFKRPTFLQKKNPRRYTLPRRSIVIGWIELPSGLFIYCLDQRPANQKLSPMYLGEIKPHAAIY